jgi:Domain of unknown function (DUF4333)
MPPGMPPRGQPPGALPPGMPQQGGPNHGGPTHGGPPPGAPPPGSPGSGGPGPDGSSSGGAPPDGSPAAGAAGPAADAAPLEAEGQPTQQWSGDAPSSWGQPNPLGKPSEPPARAWELSDTGHSIPPYPSLPEPAQPTRRGRQGLVLALLIALLLAGIVGFLGFVSPGFFLIKVLDPAAVQTGVQKVLTNDYGLTGVEGVTCGDGNRVVAGTRFECRATVNGDPFTVPIVVTTDAGDYEVGRPTPA